MAKQQKGSVKRPKGDRPVHGRTAGREKGDKRRQYHGPGKSCGSKGEKRES